MTITVRSGLTDGALQYNYADMIEVTTGSVAITANATLSVATSLSVTGSITANGSQVLTTVNGGYGYVQTWQSFPIGANVTTQRQSTTVYQNTSGKPITVAVSWPSTTGTSGGTLYVGATSSPATVISTNIATTSSTAFALSVSGVIPPNDYYQIVQASTAPTAWSELR